MIEVTSLEKAFGKRTILAGVSITFAAGKVVSLVGPSGGGKSTLLRCINGLEHFDRGEIRVGELRLAPNAKPTSARAIRLEVGMVFQQYGLFAHMTALANVMEAPVHVRRLPKEDARSRAIALLEKVGLGHRLHAYPRELSGGEQQRVAIARALAMEPRALLLDEPTSALDPDRKQEVVRVLKDLAREGMTMVIVTHEEAVVREIADRAVALREGKITSDGAPRDVLKHVAGAAR